jgi:catechol 2,3-dioxygenase-like lactoylglutathione lyase family enzyme
MTLTSTKYNVGGVLLDRPFKIRRLGHFGYNTTNSEACQRFYQELLGFRATDPRATGFGGFFRYGSDHHAMVLGDRKAAEERAKTGPMAHHYRPDNDINQITWQVQSLSEVTEATHYFCDLEIDIRNEGRAGGPGSNFHLYVYDPDEQIVELFYGIEQIGWTGHSKPVDMRHGMAEASREPHISEYAEVQDDLAKGLDMMSGYRQDADLPAKYDVDGILLPRPFKITRIGPVNLFVDDLAAAQAFWGDVMGFNHSEEVTWQAEKAVFMRCNTEHHCLGLFQKALRSKLRLAEHTTNMSFGLQLATYRQLKDAVGFLRENGVRVETDIIPPELHPGIDYAAYAFDPDGHCLELYHAMEQVGWDGQVRPKSLRPAVDPKNWPETVEGGADAYAGEPFLGPWG